MKTYYSFVIKFENKNLIIGLNRMEQLASIVLYDLGVPNFFIHKAPIFGEIDLGRQFFFFFLKYIVVSKKPCLSANIKFLLISIKRHF
jgi:hypothetical protein